MKTLFDILEDLWKNNEVSVFEVEALQELTMPLYWDEAKELEEALTSDSGYIRHRALEDMRHTHEYFILMQKTLSKEEFAIFNGYAVYDRTTDKFHKSALGEHFPTLKRILEQEYPDKFEAFEEFMFGKVKEYNGYTSEQIDSFIMDNFHLIGNCLDLSYYLRKYQ